MGSTHHHIENRGSQACEKKLFLCLARIKGKVIVQVAAKRSGQKDNLWRWS